MRLNKKNQLFFLATDYTDSTDFFSHRAHRGHRDLLGLRSAARPFSRSTLLQKAIALSAKAFGLHYEAEQIKLGAELGCKKAGFVGRIY
jgi:hypothetical protein